MLFSLPPNPPGTLSNQVAPKKIFIPQNPSPAHPRVSRGPHCSYLAPRLGVWSGEGTFWSWRSRSNKCRDQVEGKEPEADSGQRIPLTLRPRHSATWGQNEEVAARAGEDGVTGSSGSEGKMSTRLESLWLLASAKEAGWRLFLDTPAKPFIPGLGSRPCPPPPS